MPSLRLDDHDLHWREAGEGAPALLLHCSLAHAGAFSGIMARLADRLAMRAPDMPGHGRTGLVPGVVPQDQAVADALRLLEDRAPAHVIGHSFGGTVALRLALEAPERVRTLTLIEPVQFSLLDEADPAAAAEERNGQAPFLAAAAAGDWEAAAARFLARWGGAPADADPERRAYMVARMPLVAAEAHVLGDPPLARVRLADLARLRVPRLLLEGAESPPTVRAILDVIDRAAPGAERRVIASAGHMLPITHPERVAAAIAGLVAEGA